MELKCLKGIFYSHFKLLNFILQLCLGSVARFTVQDPCQFALSQTSSFLFLLAAPRKHEM